MKIYQTKPKYLIRISVTLYEANTEYLSLVDTSMGEVEKLCRKVVKNEANDPFATGRKTSIIIRESIGGKNGKSKSLSFRGMKPKQVVELIIKNLT